MKDVNIMKKRVIKSLINTNLEFEIKVSTNIDEIDDSTIYVDSEEIVDKALDSIYYSNESVGLVCQ